MKKRVLNKYSLIIAGLLFFSSCKKLTEFSVSDSAEFTVPATTALGVPINNTTSVSTSSNLEFKTNGADAKNVKEIRLSNLKLTIVDPPSEDFSFLNSIHIYIQADGMPETEIAYLDNISSSTGSVLDLVTTGAVLDDYINKENYSLRIKTVTDETLIQDIVIRSDMTFRVQAKIL